MNHVSMHLKELEKQQETIPEVGRNIQLKLDT